MDGNTGQEQWVGTTIEPSFASDLQGALKISPARSFFPMSEICSLPNSTDFACITTPSTGCINGSYGVASGYLSA